MSQVLRWSVLVDDQVHLVPADICHVAARQGDIVDVWTLPSGTRKRSVIVVGTGHEYPDEWCWLGTALAPSGLVWHLMDTRATR